jgi:hypothetical protein
LTTGFAITENYENYVKSVKINKVVEEKLDVEKADKVHKL